MGRFEHDFKNYEHYDNVDCHRKTVPSGMANVLAERFAAACESGETAKTVSALRGVANDLLSSAAKKETSNWQPASLTAEIKSAFHLLCELRFDKFMDGTIKAAERLYKSSPIEKQVELLVEINDVFVDHNFGYTLEGTTKAGKLAWHLRSPTPADTSLASAAEALKDISQEALEHLQQAKTHLLMPDHQRSRKDAVRDAMSATETLLKLLSGTESIEEATTLLRAQKVWGSDLIVKDGYSIWKHIHRLHPDIRHGAPNAPEIDFEAAIFWIDRMTAFISYMAAKKKALAR